LVISAPIAPEFILVPLDPGRDTAKASRMLAFSLGVLASVDSRCTAVLEPQQRVDWRGAARHTGAMLIVEPGAIWRVNTHYRSCHHGRYQPRPA
jgi:hypothetical protein